MSNKSHLHLALSLLSTPSMGWAGARYESKVRSIDRQVRAMDNRLDSLTRTLEDHCDENQVCTRMATYQDDKGKIQKTVQEVRSAAGPGTVTGRYYAGCKLIMVRVSPNDTEVVKNLRAIERFYFQNDKLLRVVVGEEIQAFSPEEMGYYERTFRGNLPSCTSLPINK